MNNQQQNAYQLIQDYHNELSDMNFTLSKINSGKYNFNFEIHNHNEKVKLIIYYGKKGVKVDLQGSDNSGLKNLIENKIKNQKNDPIQEKLQFIDDEPKTYIGVDESGKGNYFGPLVIAGFCVNEENRKDLISLNVRDSKTLSEKRIKNIAEELTKNFKDCYDIVIIKPSKYNELYEKNSIKNLNKLLGWGHARVIENILTKHNKCEFAICDKFGNESFIKKALLERGKKIKLIQTTKAERYLAVAAASVLARYEMLKWFDKTIERLDFKLPKGSGSVVNEAAEKLIEKFGKESLREFAKIHFKISGGLY